MTHLHIQHSQIGRTVLQRACPNVMIPVCIEGGAGSGSASERGEKDAMGQAKRMLLRPAFDDVAVEGCGLGLEYSSHLRKPQTQGWCLLHSERKHRRGCHWRQGGDDSDVGIHNLNSQRNAALVK
jgi:hypothetical protein